MNRPAPKTQSEHGTSQHKGAPCWSCLAINEQGTQVCPLCGADQTRPVPVQNLPLEHSRFGDWLITIPVFLAGIVCLAGILWYNLGSPRIDPSSETAAIVADSLRRVREVLSAYTISKGSYPATLDPVADQVDQLLQSALRAGYKIQYIPKPPSHEGPYGGFVMLARPVDGHPLNLYIDESGIVRRTEDNRSASEKDPPL